MKKVLAILVAFGLLSVAALGCGGKEVTPEEYVQGMYKLLVNMDEEGAKKVGISSGDVKKYQEALKKSADDSANKLNESFKKQYGVTVDEKLIAAWATEYFNAIKRLTCTTTVESKSDTRCKVKLSTTFIDVNALGKSAMEKSQQTIKASDYSDSEEYYRALLPEYVKVLTEELKNYQPSADTNSVTLDLKKEGKNWTYDDASKFSDTITSAVIKNDQGE